MIWLYWELDSMKSIPCWLGLNGNSRDFRCCREEVHSHWPQLAEVSKSQAQRNYAGEDSFPGY
jgi:hypothetical protein